VLAIRSSIQKRELRSQLLKISPFVPQLKIGVKMRVKRKPTILAKMSQLDPNLSRQAFLMSLGHLLRATLA
jgi:hypothetical protein